MGEKGVAAERTGNFLLADAEKRVLVWIANRLPRWILPDDLTAIGLLAAIGVGVSYGLSNNSEIWLIVASLLLILNWVGDSLDGTVARVRNIQRPKYGFYLDHIVDAIAMAAIGLGLGLSPYMLLSTGLLIVIAYLILSINVYLESMSFGEFSIGYGMIGPTELRLVLIVLNILLITTGSLSFDVLGIGMTLLDVVGLAVACVMLLLLFGRAFKNLRRLAEEEPAASRR